MSLPQRTINEVQIRLKLEPTIKEVYVEGLFDQDLYRWGLRKLKKNSVIIYPISTIDVPSELLKKYDLTSGERQRLLVFSKEIESFGDFRQSILCIVDADFDHILNPQIISNVLSGTSGTSAELLFLNMDLLLKFLEQVIAVRLPEQVLQTILQTIIPVLRNVFLIRAVNHSLKLNWQMIEIEGELKCGIDFDFNNYLEKVINKNSGRQSREIVLAEIEKLEAKTKQLQDTQVIHGHDFVNAIRKSLINAGVRRRMLADSNEVGRILLGLLEWDTVKVDEIFITLANF